MSTDDKRRAIAILDEIEECYLSDDPPHHGMGVAALAELREIVANAPDVAAWRAAPGKDGRTP